MTGRKPSIFWQVTWRFVSPLIVLVILIFYLITQAQEELTYLVWDPTSVSASRIVTHGRVQRWTKSLMIVFSASTGSLPVIVIGNLSCMDQWNYFSVSGGSYCDCADVCVVQVYLRALQAASRLNKTEDRWYCVMGLP